MKLNKIYQSITQSLSEKFNQIKKAYEYKSQERATGLFNINTRENKYFIAQLALDRKKRTEQENQYFLYEDTRNRFYNNMLRAIQGKDLIQEQEQSIGLNYNYDKGPHFIIVDESKHKKAKEDLETKLKNIKTKVSENEKYNSIKSTYNKSTSNQAIKNEAKTKPDSTNYELTDIINMTINKNDSITDINGKEKQKQNYEAAYINSYKSTSYTNQIATISAENTGTIKNIANLLSGYVMDDRNSDRINTRNITYAPQKRLWTTRIKNLEEEIIKNKFSEEQKIELKKIKQAILSNKYLQKKKPQQYQQAINIIESAIRRDYK